MIKGLAKLQNLEVGKNKSKSSKEDYTIHNWPQFNDVKIPELINFRAKNCVFGNSPDARSNGLILLSGAMRLALVRF